MLNIRKNRGKLQVRCLVRKRWVSLFPEEWVRQHFLKFLIEDLKISPLRIGVEVSLKYNSLNKRADIVVWDKQAKPFWIIECKGENTALTQDVVNQLLVYYAVLPVTHLSITNGSNVLSWRQTHGNWEVLDDWPVV